MSDEKHVLPVKKTKYSEAIHTLDLSKYGLHAVNHTGKNIRVLRNPSVAVLYEYALSKEENTTITSTGALVAYSGEKTGRSPADKRIVDTEPENKDVFWGSVNIKLPQHSFDTNKERAVDYLNTKDTLFVVDAFAGWEPTARMKVRVICSRAYHALFMLNMLIRATEEELASFGEPDLVIFNAGEFPANRQTQGMTSKASVDLNLKTRELVILGTQYAGEMKKGVFSFFHYFMPLKGYLSLHSSANMGAGGDVSLFFGLSGTGKTTLSADPRRFLIGDDEHVWFENGLFNIEGGCYAKVDKLSKEQEPEIFGAIRYGSVLENVVLDSITHEVDFNDLTITENTRASYPIEYIPNARIPCVGGHPKNIILLTCDAFGVLPPVSKLTPLQTQYHFITGYTAKVAGTEVGVTEPKATFSSCFGEAFIIHHPAKYAELLAKLMEKHNATAWLVNTGWVGGGYGVGSRIKLKFTRAMLDAIHDGTLAAAEFKTMDNFGLQIPVACKGVPDEVLFPRQAWKDQAKYDQTLKKLAEMFVKNFDKYKAGVSPQVVEAGPKL